MFRKDTRRHAHSKSIHFGNFITMAIVNQRHLEAPLKVTHFLNASHQVNENACRSQTEFNTMETYKIDTHRSFESLFFLVDLRGTYSHYMGDLFIRFIFFVLDLMSFIGHIYISLLCSALWKSINL